MMNILTEFVIKIFLYTSVSKTCFSAVHKCLKFFLWTIKLSGGSLKARVDQQMAICDQIMHVFTQKISSWTKFRCVVDMGIRTNGHD